MQAENTVSKSSALSVLPFAMTSEVTEQLNAFKEGTCNWVEMTISNEIISLVGFRSVTADDSLQSFIDTENARYRTIVHAVCFSSLLFHPYHLETATSPLLI